MVCNELLHGLLINLLVILIILLVFNFYLIEKHKGYTLRFTNVDLFTLCTVLVIFSLLLTNRVNDHFVYDLRFIPFLIGGIYGTKHVLINLGLLIILLRLPYGGDGFWFSVILIVLFTYLIITMASKLKSKSLNIRIIFFSILSFIYSLLGFLLPSLQNSFYDLKTFVVYSLTLTGSTMIVLYLCEIIRTTYRHQLQALKCEKMQFASHLAASISHEVRNPLTTVKGFLQLIKENPYTHPSNLEYSRVALEEADRATEIINQYLIFAKPHPENEICLHIQTEIERCLHYLQPFTKEFDTKIEVSYRHRNGILGEPNKFEQVLLNICRNSLDAMETGGSLSIDTSEQDDSIMIRIKDNGIGMTKEQVSRLGEPYFTLKGTKGTGLGMMTVFQIVSGMNGMITINSKPKSGTEVILSFPVHCDEKTKTGTG